MVTFSFPAISVDTTGLATESEQQAQTTELQGINTELDTITGHVDGIETLITSTNSKLDTVIANTDKLAIFQVSALIDASSTNIPGSASLPLELITSTSAAVKRIQVVEDIGEYMALYTGPASSEVLLCALPLGGGDVEVSVPAATRISIKALKTPAITSSNIIINLLG